MNESNSTATNRRIRVFVSSTFRDMVEDRNELMTHAWPELRKFCRERQVELVEVDLRWGISQEQATRKETLKLCLDEIRACRPFFIGLLGERYGWVPDPDAFTADLREEQPWVTGLQDRSVTELEIIYGVLREPQMHQRAFFYFRDPHYLDCLPPGSNRADFESESPAAKAMLEQLKQTIRHARDEQICHLRENYSDPRQLAKLVLEELKTAIEEQFPVEQVPDPLTREASDHEAFAEIRRRTYIGRTEYFEALDKHAASDGGPLVLLGVSGSGKSALLANWLEHWRAAHTKDLIFQHYIGGTPDSAEHWRLMSRLIAEIKRWTNDPEELPRTHDDLLRDFSIWLAKARSKAERDRVRFIVVLDALNQLQDQEHARSLGWLPEHPFTGPLRFIVSTLPGETLEAVQKRGWANLRVELLTEGERCRMIADYLQRFGKQLDAPRRDRLAASCAAANPLYLKILLDELCVTGTHDRLDERLGDYLAAADIPALLQKVLARYRRDYERDRPGLVNESLGLIWAARRGLTETELLHLLKPADLPQLPLVTWTPLRAALEEMLVDRNGILNFAHNFLRTAVEGAYVPNQDQRDELRLRLADYFETEAPPARGCDELPWLLWQTESFVRLRACLLKIDSFILVYRNREEELRSYWVYLGEEETMGKAYLESFRSWSQMKTHEPEHLSFAATELGSFLLASGLAAEAEALLHYALQTDEKVKSPDDSVFALRLSNLAMAVSDQGRHSEADSLLMRAERLSKLGTHDWVMEVAILNNRAIQSNELGRLHEAESFLRKAMNLAKQHNLPTRHKVMTARNLASQLNDLGRHSEAESICREALADATMFFGDSHPTSLLAVDTLCGVLLAKGQADEAIALMRQCIRFKEVNYGGDHMFTADSIGDLAQALFSRQQYVEAEMLLRRVLAIHEQKQKENRPSYSRTLNNLGELMEKTGRLREAETVFRRALLLDEHTKMCESVHAGVHANNLGALLIKLNAFEEAETLLRRALSIDKNVYGGAHPNVAIRLNNLAKVLEKTGKLPEAESCLRQALDILESAVEKSDVTLLGCLDNLTGLLTRTERAMEAVVTSRKAIDLEMQRLKQQRVLSKDTALRLNNHATLSASIGCLDEAEKCLRMAVLIYNANRPPSGDAYPELEQSLQNYGTILMKNGRTRIEALDVIKEVLPNASIA